MDEPIEAADLFRSVGELLWVRWLNSLTSGDPVAIGGKSCATFEGFCDTGRGFARVRIGTAYLRVPSTVLSQVDPP